jgi:hypothetical protein
MENSTSYVCYILWYILLERECARQTVGECATKAYGNGHLCHLFMRTHDTHVAFPSINYVSIPISGGSHLLQYVRTPAFLIGVVGSEGFTDVRQRGTIGDEILSNMYVYIF